MPADILPATRPRRRTPAPTATGSKTGADRFRWFLHGFGTLLAGDPDEPVILAQGGSLLSRLVAVDDWLPAAFSVPDPQCYRQYLLYCENRERFSVVAFVWGPGQHTPVHNHTVWGLVGMLRGAEMTQAYKKAGVRLRPFGAPERLVPGQVTAVSPTVGDLHRVANAYDDGPSVSIHVYGGNIGRIRRTAYDEQGRPTRFVSGYSNDTLPNPWR